MISKYFSACVLADHFCEIIYKVRSYCHQNFGLVAIFEGSQIFVDSCGMKKIQIRAVVDTPVGSK